MRRRLLMLSGNNLLVPGAIFVGAIIAGAAAAFSITLSRIAERRKNTLDFLNMKFTRPEVLNGIEEIRKIARKYDRSKNHPEPSVLHAFQNRDRYRGVNWGD